MLHHDQKALLFSPFDISLGSHMMEARMAGRGHSTIRSVLLIVVIVAGCLFTERTAKASHNCGNSWIFCDGETIDSDLSLFPGSNYIETNSGNGRFGLTCVLDYYPYYCSLYGARWTGSAWSLDNTQWLGYGNEAVHVYMDGDGNLEVYNSGWGLVWESNSDIGDDDAYLELDDDGCAKIFNEEEDTVIWSLSGCAG